MVIDVGTNRKPVCDFVLLITVSELSQLLIVQISELIVQISDTLRFWATLWGLRDNVRCSSWAHWRSGLSILVNWTFSPRCYGWRVTSENRSKIGDFASARPL